MLNEPLLDLTWISSHPLLTALPRVPPDPHPQSGSAEIPTPSLSLSALIGENIFKCHFCNGFDQEYVTR